MSTKRASPGLLTQGSLAPPRCSQLRALTDTFQPLKQIQDLCSASYPLRAQTPLAHSRDRFRGFITDVRQHESRGEALDFLYLP